MTRALAPVAVVVVLLLAGFGPHGVPPAGTADPDLLAAEKLWKAAEHGEDHDAWVAVAIAYGAVVAGTTATRAEKIYAAHAAVTAWRTAVVTAPAASARDDQAQRVVGFGERVPDRTPMSGDEASLILAAEAMFAIGPTPTDEAAVRYVVARLYHVHNWFAEAIAVCATIIERFPADPVTESAAQQMLDDYNLGLQYDALVAQAEAWRADRAFLAGKPDLATTVATIHVQAGRKQAEKLERRAKEDGDPAAYDRCGEAYAALGDEPGIASRESEETDYNAGVCFEGAGSLDRAVAQYAEVARGDNHRLAQAARARTGVALAAAGRYAEAAAALEAYVEQATDEKDAVDAASDAVYYAIATGDLKRAARVADRAGAAHGHRSPVLAAETALIVIEAMVAAGQHKAAARRARAAMKLRTLASDPLRALRAGRALAAAACPVALVDDLCPRARDKALAGAARKLFAVAARGDEPAVADDAARRVLDLELEPMLASGQAVDTVLDGYRRLADDHHPAATQVVAHARLARWAERHGADDTAEVERAACAEAARAGMVGAEWLDPAPEHLMPQTGIPPADVEGARLARPLAP